MNSVRALIKNSMLEPAGRRWSFVAMAFFLVLAFAVNHKFTTYDYHMDDAWIIGVNHQDSSLLTLEGWGDALESAQNQYSEQWHTSQRFPGFVPITRLIQINLISANVRAHLVLNLIFHALNALLLSFVLIRILRVGTIPAVAFSGLFALALNLGSGSYALSLWIGSSYVNLLSIFLLLCLAVSGKMAIARWFLYLAYAVYVIFAIGDYAAAVILPPLAVVHYMKYQNLRRAITFTLILSIPIFVNLVIISFAPESTYIGTTINLEAAHIWNNLSGNLATLLGPSPWINAAILGVLSLALAYGWMKKIISVTEILLPTFLILGMIGLYSLSARQDFPNPYFLYIPFSGLIMLLALATKALLPFGKGSLISALVIFSAIVSLGSYQYSSAEEYRKLREDSSVRIANLRKDFRAVETITRSKEKRLVAILYEDVYTRTGALGYFDKTINTWKSKGNQSTYILVSDLIPDSDPLNAKVKADYNQYYPVPKYMSIAEIQREHGVPPSSFLMLQIIDGKVSSVDLSPTSHGVVLDASYDRERYGDGKYYTWTDGRAVFHVYNKSELKGRNAVLSFSVTSLFDDRIELIYKDSHDFVDVVAQKPTRVCERIVLDADETLLQLKSGRSIVPPGDSRLLSFRVDHDFYIRLADEPIIIGKNLSGYETAGFYNLEQDYFRWVQPESSITFPECAGRHRGVKLVLRGSFPDGNAPVVMINGSIKSTQIEQIDSATVKYYFPYLEGELSTVEFKTMEFVPKQPDPRHLGFMFVSLDVEFES